MELPQLNSTPFAKLDIEVKNKDEAHIKHKKTRHRAALLDYC
jgi:hypothetical protein